MLERAHAAWKTGHITGVRLMHIKATFPSMAKGRLVNVMKDRQMDEDLLRWTESFPWERTVEMVIEGNATETQPVEAGVPQDSPVSPILFKIYTSGLIKWVEQYVSEAEGLSVVGDLGLVMPGRNVKNVVSILERCTEKSIVWESRRGLQFDIAKTQAALFTHRGGNRKQDRAKLTTKIRVGNESVRFNSQATCCVGMWMDAHVTFKEQHMRCMKKARAAETRLGTINKR